MKVRFLADANFNRRIVAGVRRRETQVEFLSAEQVNLVGVPDLDVLALAAAETRILVSHDVRTMPAAFAEFIVANNSSGVILLAQSLDIGAAVTILLRIWEDSNAEEWKNRIACLPL